MGNHGQKFTHLTDSANWELPPERTAPRQYRQERHDQLTPKSTGAFETQCTARYYEEHEPKLRTFLSQLDLEMRQIIDYGETGSRRGRVACPQDLESAPRRGESAGRRDKSTSLRDLVNGRGGALIFQIGIRLGLKAVVRHQTPVS
jgi:hypothetical protein